MSVRPLFRGLLQGGYRCTQRTLTIDSHKVNTSGVWSILEDLRHVVGEENVSTGQSVREHHGKDESYHLAELPDVVVFPGNTSEVSRIMKLCNTTLVPVIPFGTGTGFEGGTCAPEGGVSIDLSRLTTIESIHPEDFDCTVYAGVTRKTLNKELRSTGLMFPVDPGADASLCGMCATSASGTNAVRYGTMRENVMNLEVVLADGRVIHTAGKGRRTKKTSAGYNLTNLFVGSEGTLGVITRATLKLYGIPESSASAVCQFLTVQAAVEASVQIMQSGIPVARIEFLDDEMMNACNKYSNLNYKKQPTLFFEFHGSEEEVKKQAELSAEICSYNEGEEFQWATSAEECNKLWQARHEAWYAATAMRPGLSKAIGTDICVPVSQIPACLAAIRADLEEVGVTAPTIGHIGDGNLHVLPLLDYSDPEERKLADFLVTKIGERAQEHQGTCTGEHGIGLGKRHLLLKEVGEECVAVMRDLKQSLDPNNILNPGKIFYN